MTKTVARLTDLINRADALELLAGQIQDDDAAAPHTLLRQLQTAYGAWYAEALALLSSEEAKPFREEYEGGFLSYKIKHFLQEGLEQQSQMLAELVAQGMPKWRYPTVTTFHGPLLQQKQILRNAVALASGKAGVIGILDTLEDTYRNLASALAVLRDEVRGRPGLPVNDEYDLQRIVHSFLCLQYSDVRPEEHAPSRAGVRPRIDFLLKIERVVVETKMTRDSLGKKQLGDELAADVLRYQSHPDASGYFALVYDPSRRIGNSRGFEADFPTDASFPTRVVIVH